MSDPHARPAAVELMIALNEELRALARCGVPLEKGLRALGGEHDRPLRQIADEVATRLERGESLGEALSAIPSLPKSYAAVVEAGVASGQLVEVLDGVTLALRRQRRVQAAFRTALLYPLLVAGLAFVFLLATLKMLSPVAIEAVEEGGRPLGLFAFHRELIATMPYWMVLAPLAAATLLAVAYWAGPLRNAASGFWLSGGLLWRSRLATFAELTGLLLKRGTPLDGALQLSAAAIGHAGLQHYADQFGEHLRRGAPPPKPPPHFPPVLAWQLQQLEQSDQLISALDQEAASLRRMAEAEEAWWSNIAPAAMSLLLAAAAVALYGFIALAPWFGYFYRYGTLEVIP